MFAFLRIAYDINDTQVEFDIPIMEKSDYPERMECVASAFKMAGIDLNPYDFVSYYIYYKLVHMDDMVDDMYNPSGRVYRKRVKGSKKLYEVDGESHYIKPR